MEDKFHVFAHIVTFNNAVFIEKCLDALLKQNNFVLGKNLHVRITDNASSDLTLQALQSYQQKTIEIVCNDKNIGFCAAHNQGVAEFIKSQCAYYLCLNPDLRLEENCLFALCEKLAETPLVGSVCPKLLRADQNLNPLSPNIIDAAGIFITPSLRHFDIGSGEIDCGQYNSESFVFGGSGACLLMKRRFIEDAAWLTTSNDPSVTKVYPQLEQLPVPRLQLFDEAFFAYREDADLAWRAQLLGWSCMYVPSAIGYHVRKVVPERRSDLPAMLNLLGVKNRFLLQLNNYNLDYGLIVFCYGYVLRNILVILAVCFKEFASFPAFMQLLTLLPASLRKRKRVFSKARQKHKQVARWFKSKPYYESTIQQ